MSEFIARARRSWALREFGEGTYAECGAARDNGDGHRYFYGPDCRLKARADRRMRGQDR